MRTLVCTAALLVFFIAIHQEVEAQSGCQESCQNFSNDTNGVFNAQCKTISGNFLGTSINLDTVIGKWNDDGTVEGGGFSRSCQKERLVDEQGTVFIVAECKQDDGTLISTSYDICNHLVDNNETLIGTLVRLIW